MVSRLNDFLFCVFGTAARSARDNSIAQRGRYQGMGIDRGQAGDSHQHWILMSPAHTRHATDHHQ